MAKADDEINALTILADRNQTQLAQTKKENNELKRGMNPLGIAGMGGVSAATGAALGVLEGYRAGEDQALQKAQAGVMPAAALVVGGIGALAAGANNPKLRATAAGVATGGATVLAYTVAYQEGVQMKLESAKQRAQGQAAQAGPQIQGAKR